MIDSPVLWLPEDVGQQMFEFASAKHPLETGGVMLGYANPPHVVVREIIGPGPSAKHYRYRFIPVPAPVQRQLRTGLPRPPRSVVADLASRTRSGSGGRARCEDGTDCSRVATPRACAVHRRVRGTARGSDIHRAACR